MDVKPWNDRYRSGSYVYGTAPNAFFKEQLDPLPPGRIYLPGDGEGRNGVYAAARGWDVLCVDWSDEARLKAEKLAAANNVSIDFQVCSLLDYRPPAISFDVVAATFIHLTEEERQFVHHHYVEALKPGGLLIFIGYSVEQLKLGTGGPQDESRLFTLEDIISDFIDLEFLTLSREIEPVHEGSLHTGEGSVLKFTGKKPL